MAGWAKLLVIGHQIACQLVVVAAQSIEVVHVTIRIAHIEGVVKQVVLGGPLDPVGRRSRAFSPTDGDEVHATAGGFQDSGIPALAIGMGVAADGRFSQSSADQDGRIDGFHGLGELDHGLPVGLGADLGVVFMTVPGTGVAHLAGVQVGLGRAGFLVAAGGIGVVALDGISAVKAIACDIVADGPQLNADGIAHADAQVVIAVVLGQWGGRAKTSPEADCLPVVSYGVLADDLRAGGAPVG